MHFFAMCTHVGFPREEKRSLRFISSSMKTDDEDFLRERGPEKKGAQSGFSKSFFCLISSWDGKRFVPCSGCVLACHQKSILILMSPGAILG